MPSGERCIENHEAEKTFVSYSHEDEPYFWEHLVFHLNRAGLDSELIETVKHWRWLVTKTRKGKAIAVETDLDEALSGPHKDKTLQKLERAFANSNRWLDGSTQDEIEAKLYARLQHLRGYLIAMPLDLEVRLKAPDIAVIFDFPEMLDNSGSVKSCSYSRECGRMVAVLHDDTLKIWDTQAGTPLPLPKGYPEYVTSCAFSPDGSRIVLSLSDNTLLVHGLNSEDVPHPLKGHFGPVTSCAFSPNNSLIAAASSDGKLRIWNAQEGRTRRLLERVSTWKESEEVKVRVNGHQKSVNDCVFSPDSEWIVSASDDETLKVWNVKSGKPAYTLMGHAGAVKCCAISRDGKYLASGSEDGQLRIWDAEKWTAFRLPPRESEIESDGNSDLRTEERPWEGWHEKEINGCAFSSDGQLLVSASSDGTFRAWEVASGKCIATFHDEGEMYCCLMHDEMIFGGGTRGVYFLKLIGQNLSQGQTQ